MFIWLLFFGFFGLARDSLAPPDALGFPLGGGWMNKWEEGIPTRPANTAFKARQVPLISVPQIPPTLSPFLSLRSIGIEGGSSLS